MASRSVLFPRIIRGWSGRELSLTRRQGDFAEIFQKKECRRKRQGQGDKQRPPFAGCIQNEPSRPRSIKRTMRAKAGARLIRIKLKGLLQIIEIGRDGFHLCPRQAVRNRLHDGRYILFSWVLATLLVPVFQFIEEVVMELPGQTRKRPVPFGLRAVTDSAGRNT